MYGIGFPSNHAFRYPTTEVKRRIRKSSEVYAFTNHLSYDDKAIATPLA
jgi:hypothetical protein